MDRIDEEITRLRRLIQLEREEEYAIYTGSILKASLEERRRKGVCWQPLKIMDSGYGMGDYPYLIVERTRGAGIPHQFSSGSMASLYTIDREPGADPVSGTIHWADEDKLKIILHSEDIPDWVNRCSLGINFMFDEKTYREMDRTLEEMLEKRNRRVRNLFEKSRGYSPFLFREEICQEILSLNESQNRALRKVMGAQDIAVVHGPPGTGKTTTLVEIVLQLVKREKQVLVCAPSNTACDLLAEKLGERGLEVLRLGNLSRIDPVILELTLEHKIDCHDQAKEIRKIRRRAGELRAKAGKYKRNFGKAEREERRFLYKEAKALAREAIDLENYVVQFLLDSTQVICTTLVGARQKELAGRHFRTVVIDEAAQALEPACWIPILKAEKVVFVGDPYQLPPTIKSLKAGKEGLGITLMENCLASGQDASLLQIQYRMHTMIMEFSNRCFYGGQLQAHESVANHTLEALENYPSIPLEFIDTSGTGFQEEEPTESNSLENKGEQEIIKKHLSVLLSDPGFDPHISIGIISPYKAQVLALREQFRHYEPTAGCDLSINTVDAFQGQERDVIYISLVRSNPTGTIGFLSDLRRMNVAMTRARKKLVIVGDSATLTQHKFYQDLFDYAEEVGGYRSAFELLYLAE